MMSDGARGAAALPWTVTAVNLPEHAGNRIHTDEGARAAGFPAALVAGVTTYVYLTRPVIGAWGIDWVRHGRATVRFFAPVLDGDLLTCTPRAQGATLEVAATATRADRPLAVLAAQPRGSAPTSLPAGERLPDHHVLLAGEHDARYAARCGDDLDLLARAGIVHPATWLSLANHVFHRELARGPWVHTRSIVQHHALAHEGATATVRSTVVERFHRRGERAVAHVEIEVAGTVVATLEHEAIIAM